MDQTKKIKLSSSQNLKSKINEVEKLVSIRNSFVPIAPAPIKNKVHSDTSPGTSKQVHFSQSPSVEDRNNSADSSVNLIPFSELELKDPGCWPKLSQNVINLLVEERPVQLKDFNFPVTNKRKFNSKYYYKNLPNGEKIHRSWLVYSKTLDRVFCFCCKLFSESRNGFLTSSGLCDWNHLTQNLISHEKSIQHLDCFEKWKKLEIEIKHNKTTDSELLQINNITRETDKYRAILKCLIICVKYLGTQSIEFHGCTENMYKTNNGNFFKLVESFAEIDPVMSTYLHTLNEKGSTHGYLGRTIQNELINLIGREVRQKIVSMILASKYYSIIVDCTKDIGHQERLSLVIRFAYKEDNNTFRIREHFLGFLDTQSSTGLTELILNKLAELGLSIDFLRGQGYDYNSNTKGKKSGVQDRIIELEHRAFFVPCTCHSLNLIINDAAQSSLDAVCFFGIVQSIYVFFSASDGRWGILKKHVKDLTVKRQYEIQWSSRVDALKIIRTKLKYIIEALIEIEENDSDKYTREEAKTIADKITNFKFVCCLVVWFDILHDINYASKSLQSVEKHIVSSSEGIFQSSKEYLERYRSDESFNNVLETAKEICDDIGIEDKFIESTSTRSRLNKMLVDYRDFENPIIDLQTKFKVDFVAVVLDRAISSLNERFKQLYNHNRIFSVLHNIGEFVPSDNSRESCLNLELVLTKGKNYDIKGLDLFEELTKLSTRVPKGSNCLDILNFIIRDGLEGLFPNAFIGLRILLTLPVTVVSAEPSFSKLKFIKNYLRMSQEKSAGLAFMSIESDICRSIEYDDLISKFANAKAREVVF